MVVVVVGVLLDQRSFWLVEILYHATIALDVEEILSLSPMSQASMSGGKFEAVACDARWVATPLDDVDPIMIKHRRRQYLHRIYTHASRYNLAISYNCRTSWQAYSGRSPSTLLRLHPRPRSHLTLTLLNHNPSPCHAHLTNHD